VIENRSELVRQALELTAEADTAALEELCRKYIEEDS
jgi:Arc/MetJ-type ribon-helix-helix transcriptional regulator